MSTEEILKEHTLPPPRSHSSTLPECGPIARPTELFKKLVKLLQQMLKFFICSLFHRRLLSRLVESDNFLPGMIVRTRYQSCDQMVDCRCVQGLSMNVCLMRLQRQCKYRIQIQMWVRIQSSCI